MSTQLEYEPRICSKCKRELHEQFDCYVDICSECEHGNKVLVNAEGTWVWKSPFAIEE